MHKSEAVVPDAVDGRAGRFAIEKTGAVGPSVTQREGDQADGSVNQRRGEALVPFGGVRHDHSGFFRGGRRHQRSFFQAGAHQILDRRRRAKRGLRGAHGIVRLDLLETQRHQRQHGVIDLLVAFGKRALRAQRLPRARRADFVLELDDNALGGFFSDAGNLRKRLDIAIGHRAAQGGHVHAAQNVQRELGADAADGVDEQAEHFALGRGHETVKDMGILADGKVREQFHIVSRRGQLVV